MRKIEARVKAALDEQAKANQATSTGGRNPQLLQKSAKADPINTRRETAKAAGVSTDTVSKVRKIEAEAKKRQVAAGKNHGRGQISATLKQFTGLDGRWFF